MKRLLNVLFQASGIIFLASQSGYCGEADIVLPALTGRQLTYLWVVLGSAFVALGYGVYLVRKVISADRGSAKMQQVALAIEQGAMAYLKRQVGTMIWFVLAITAILYFSYRNVPATAPFAMGIAAAFFLGVAASYGAGFVGMWLAVKGNLRSAAAALKSFKNAMELAFQAGAVSGMFTVGFGLLGATIIFLLYKENAMKVLIGFGFGGSLAALFMRVGGGIFTKAADVGADLVGKVEKDIPEDDPRNAATIADNVGDNVGDCAGMAADVFESYEVTLVAAIILGAALLVDPVFSASYGVNAGSLALKLILFPLLLRAVGVFSSIAGIWSVKVRGDSEKIDPMKPIVIGYAVSSIASIVGFWIINTLYLKVPTTMVDGSIVWIPDYRFFWATTLGIGLSVATLWLTNVFTHPDKTSATETAYSAKTGPATVILTGMAAGMESTVWAILLIGGTIIGSMLIFHGDPAMAAYGIALAGLGLLTTTGFILAMDTYGPITDNAHGIFEMSDVRDEKAGRTLSWMDAIGNTTKALTKGLAIATAVIAAISLFRSFLGESKLELIGIQIDLPKVFVGLLIGAAVPFLFSAFALKAVSRAANQVVEEVRRQFREHPGIMTGKELPDYSTCVAIVTATAQKELIGPGILAVFSPILVGFMLGAAALGGFLGGAIVVGQLLAVYMANTGAIWDNAKKKIEDGLFGGKGTPEHKATVIGDTVGDPYKDTAGPALNPMIKVMNLVAILIAPFIISVFAMPNHRTVRAVVVVVCAAALGVAVFFSKRGSLVEDAKAKQ